MNEGLVDNLGSGRGPGEEDMEINGEVLKPTNDLLIEREERTEVGDNGMERTSQVLSPLEALAPSDSLDIQDHATSVPVMTGHGQTEKIPGGVAEEQPVDWFEPLEDDNYEDDTQGWNLGLAMGERRVNGKGDAEEESVAGSERSERSGSVADLEKKINSNNLFSVYRRKKRVTVEEGWEDWPALGKGWKRKAVVRRSGSSVGQSDVYYMSPSNERVRSRVELSKVLADTQDMTMFDYKAGVFRGAGQPKPLRARKTNIQKDPPPLVDCGFSSESSLKDRGDRADSPDSHHRLTPLSRSSMGTPSKDLQHTTPPRTNSSLAKISSASVAHDVEGMKQNATKLPLSPASSLSVSINGMAGSEPFFCICAICGNSYTGLEYERQMKSPCCTICRANNPAIAKFPLHQRFRKWIPCGNCRACLTTEDCGSCANCKKTLNPDTRKRVRCQKRKCKCPILKYKPDGPQMLDPYPMANFKIDSRELQNSTSQYSDPEDFSVNVDIEDDDEEFDGDDADYEAWVRKRKRRSCGKCEACNSRTDCGTCDFCIDKPKFGGSNKKRQKCRLRQCQRQAMRHLLPFQLGQTDFGSQEGWVQLGRPRPHFTYSRKTTPKKRKTPHLEVDMEFTDDEDEPLQEEEDYRYMETAHWRPMLPSKPQDENFRNHIPTVQAHKETVEIVKNNSLLEHVPDILNLISSPAYCTLFKPADPAVKYVEPPVENTSSAAPDRQSGMNGGRPSVDTDVETPSGEPEVEEVTPMITQIFSLADSAGTSGIDQEHELLKLLKSIHSSALPTLWFAIMVEGPTLQLLQCSKLSHMVDTTVQIDPSFYYQICVQGQPLLLTHPLYEAHPSCLTSVPQVANLLLDLEKYSVCQGVPTKEQPFSQAPIIIERASTCDFLVLKETEHCARCKALSCSY
ncbi:methyl-CpG-binding domain protein 1-like isoform X1 [Salvelinus namaycush]|uniref:Methyl-CpG-binding domain protein 1-like isoform X1 n=1 Tax=Salvelinus namaycush TaxID=8040 RepID=A0A8U1H7V4_SALNM|nr:methyl-CpG-binding domain protein 1-like isoform X1 [Salvelinus namaycush]XP_038871664.1 methyl-CpG-binding domain protein 1-like isoform X1 [Salvelinus namaycush]XP_038871665.1 methyl-CpG-binding domain protein 1-like isoform X1 [Salvelinus namaycush]XP_038871667.1 methyl-CpG-binding domain protein 1-like isoform X1 [Salvelinus namaycush]